MEGLERGLSSLSHRGVYMSAADVERERERLKGWAGKLLVLIPGFSLSFSFKINIKVLLLLLGLSVN